MTFHLRDLSNLTPTPTGAADAGHGLYVYRDYLKRVFDVTATLLAAPIVLPLIGILALLTTLDGGKPFYLQRRIGRNGKVFRIVKLRTMVPNAEEMLCAHLAADPAARKEWDVSQKLKDDPRITRFGRVLRRTSLDELPQLWNVMTGAMSLVGPRPMMVEQADAYPGSSYFELRPGITGPWQVSDRNRCEFAARAWYDDRYYEEMSLSHDLGILVRTAPAVFRCTGY